MKKKMSKTKKVLCGIGVVSVVAFVVKAIL